LTRLRSEIRRVKSLEGLLASLTVLLVSFLLLFALERLCELPVFLRILLLGSGIAVISIGAAHIWRRWIRGQRRLEDVAQLIRRTFPPLGDQLLGTIELARDIERPNAPRGSQRLVQAAIAQAAERLRKVNLSPAIPATRHRTWAALTLILATLMLLSFFIVPLAASNSLLRWLLPWSQAPRYTFAQVEQLPDPLIVPRAESFRIEPRLHAHSPWKPASATAVISGQPELRGMLKPNSASYALTFPPQKNDQRIKLRIGDAIESITLQPRNRPELSRLAAILKLPDYLEYSSKPRIEIHGGSVRILKGSKVALEAGATRALASAFMDGQPQPIDEQGCLRTAFLELETSREHQIEWLDALGLGPRDPVHVRLEACADSAPTISAICRVTERVVLDTEVIRFDLSALDDFGIRAIGLQWHTADSSEQSAGSRKLSSEGGPEIRELQTLATFCARDEGIASGRVSLHAWAEDYMPDRDASHSTSFVIQIVDTTEHALWLAGEFSKWLDATRETYEREQQLNLANRKLRAMDSDQLDNQDTRRSIAQQADMEQENADRLTRLTAEGRRLVELGTRNTEFNAAQLESWAAIIERLDQLAVQRMPSVSDLLRQSSRADTHERSQSSPSQDRQTASPASTPPADNASGEQQPRPATDPEQPSALPSLVDAERGFLEAPASPANESNDPAQAASGPGLPETMLDQVAGAEQREDSGPASPAATHLEEAVTEQDDLLAEFRAVSELLAELLGSFEASTFVKRLKAASRAQMEIAGDINSSALSIFGLPAKSPEIRSSPATSADDFTQRMEAEIRNIHTIQSDLSAFLSRKPDRRFNTLQQTMKEERLISELEAIPVTVRKNWSGDSIARTEFWADTLDRWAEELVAATTAPP
jgi:hypothetical protein